MGVYRTDFGTVTGMKRTPQGGLRVDARLTKAGVLRYRDVNGNEWGELRPAEEVFRPDSLQTLADAPVTVNHPPGLITAENWKQHSKGHVAETPTREEEYVAAPIVVQDAEAVAAIERGDLHDVSAGYTCDIDPTPGVFEGVPYQQVQRNVRYNHAALLPEGAGRAGADVCLRLDGSGVQLREDAPTHPAIRKAMAEHEHAKTQAANAEYSNSRDLPAARERVKATAQKLAEAKAKHGPEAQKAAGEAKAAKATSDIAHHSAKAAESMAAAKSAMLSGNAAAARSHLAAAEHHESAVRAAGGKTPSHEHAGGSGSGPGQNHDPDNGRFSGDAAGEEVGFKALSAKIAKSGSASDPDAVAAAIGRKKYGQAEMTRRSVAARKNAAKELTVMRADARQETIPMGLKIKFGDREYRCDDAGDMAALEKDAGAQKQKYDADAMSHDAELEALRSALSDALVMTAQLEAKLKVAQAANEAEEASEGEGDVEPQPEEVLDSRAARRLIARVVAPGAALKGMRADAVRALVATTLDKLAAYRAEEIVKVRADAAKVLAEADIKGKSVDELRRAVLAKLVPEMKFDAADAKSVAIAFEAAAAVAKPVEKVVRRDAGNAALNLALNSPRTDAEDTSSEAAYAKRRAEDIERGRRPLNGSQAK